LRLVVGPDEVCSKLAQKIAVQPFFSKSGSIFCFVLFLSQTFLNYGCRVFNEGSCQKEVYAPDKRIEIFMQSIYLSVIIK